MTCLNDAECGPDPFGIRDVNCVSCDSSVGVAVNRTVELVE